MDTDVGPLDAAEEAFDVVRVHSALRLVLLAVVHPEQVLQACQVVVREALVGMDARSFADVLPDEFPCLVRMLATHDAGQRPLSAAAKRRLLPERQDREALEVLVLGAASVDAIAVLLLDVTAGVLAVDVDLALQHHPEPSGRDRLAHLHEQHPCRLVLDAELAGELERTLAFDRVHREPEASQNVLEAHLAEGEDRAGRHRKFPAAGLAFEAPTPDLPAVRMRTADAGRSPFRIRPADEAERLGGLGVVERAEMAKRERPAIRGQQEVLVSPIFLPSGGPPDRVRPCAAAE